jgi:transcriptional regulator with XRE-family HTH domain
MHTIVLAILTLKVYDNDMLNEYVKTIKTLRVEKGISQSEIAEKLGMTRTTYINVEQGKRELTLGEFEKLSGVLGVSLEEIKSGQIPNYEKYKQMILSFLKLEDKIPKTKLAKLLYLADFGWFYYHLESMSGMQYRKQKYGPVSDTYFRMIDEMLDNGEIQIEQTPDGAMLISNSRTSKKAELSKINKDEQKLIKNIDEKWKGHKTAEIVDFTHKQFPFLYAGDNEIVSYNLFTQEDPDEIY